VDAGSACLASCSNPISGLTAQRYWRLVVMPAKHSKHRMQGRISSTSPARAFFGKSGSAIMARAAITTSTLPEAIISSMSSGSPSAPTEEVKYLVLGYPDHLRDRSS
jgi:hypothetical protein